MGVYGKSMESLWKVYGKSMESLWGSEQTFFLWPVKKKMKGFIILTLSVMLALFPPWPKVVVGGEDF